jgi:hypothetical protein
MTLPDVFLTVQDGGLGAVTAQDVNNAVVIGNSSAGSTSTGIGPFYTRKADLIAAYGYGKGVEAACLYIDAGIPVAFMKTPNTTPGASGAVTHVGTGASVMSVSVGVAYDDYEVVVKIITGAATVGSGTVVLQYSLDGGITYSANKSMSGTTYAISNTGLTVSFTAASAVAGDTYSFSTTAPVWGSSDLTTAIGALTGASQSLWRLIHVVGAASASVAGTVDTAIQSLAATPTFRYTAVILDSVGFGTNTEAQWITALLADYATFSSVDGRVSVGAGPVRIPSAISSSFQVRSVAWLAVRKAMTSTIHTDIAETTQPLTGIQDITGFTVVYHDEQRVQGLDAARFITMRTITGRVGYFITNPNTMAPSGSDFNLLQYLLVMNVACATTRQYFLTALNRPVRVDPTTGHILEKDALGLQAGNDAALSNALFAPGHISANQTQVARDDNILSTKTLTVNVFIVPLGYAKFINVTIGFVQVLPLAA